ncbi:MAG TPA: DUF2403 domain-containing lipoprotein [Polyangiaceae bacterium]|nr:DUF2403 domain-containing lipoprotein [Polyangiaceae bacterium]
MRRRSAAGLALALLAGFVACSSGKPAADGASGTGSSEPSRAGASGKEARPADAGAGPSAGGPSAGGSEAAGGNSQAQSALGPFPYLSSPVTRGGTMTFSNIGAPGSWPRRLDRPAGDAACDYKDGTDTWGGHCCQETYETKSDKLAPFDQEMTLIVKAINIKQLAVYQPSSAANAAWDRVTAWDQRGRSENIWFTQKGAGSTAFPGDLTRNDCVGYVMQEPTFECGDGRDYYCPSDPGILHRGFAGSKLVVFLGSMDIDDAKLKACDRDGAGKPGPWLAFVASELVRDGGRKWNGLCNCYSKTGTVGDGCGEINVFEVVLDDNEFSNREFASTGVRSYQAGHVGGAVCKADCQRAAIAPTDVEVVDACAKRAYEKGPELVAGGATDGCPVWRRPEGDRYFFILLDEVTRQIQVGIIHPNRLPARVSGLLPSLPGSLARASIDALLELRLPE